ncbi:hypothetical protein [Plantactinospora sp. CA-290183]|uniref:hypothetical protein n=1 Tax=Plantactinospora sp. CA-290183 TaxID=3240006 RepID=UPI003D8EE276
MGTRTELSDLIRAMARRDWGTADRLIIELDKLGWQGGPQVIGAAFAIAVNRKFDSTSDAREVARFVAQTRSQYEEGDQLPALETEGLIRAALGEVELADSIQPATALKIQIAIIGKLLQDANLTEPQLEEFLADVEETAAGFM